MKNASANLKNVSISNDLTQEERQKRKNLVETAKNLSEREKSLGTEWFHLVRQGKIVKVKRRQDVTNPRPTGRETGEETATKVLE